MEVNEFFKQRGYTKGTYESLLSNFGIKPSQSKSGPNVNQKEFSSYLTGYMNKLEKDPSKTLPSYSRMEQGFNEAKNYFNEMLPALQPRYQNLLNQLAGEQQVAQERNMQMSGKENTALKNELAKRGLSSASTDTYASGQFNQIGELQNTRAKETDLQFSRERLMTEESRTAEENRIRTNLASLTVDQSKTLNDVLNVEKSRVMQAIETGVNTGNTQKSMQLQAEQWEKNFQFMKDKDAADRALDYMRLATSKDAAAGEKSYAKNLLGLVENAYSAKNKFPYMREGIEGSLLESFPEKANTIMEDIKRYFPDGWESQATSKQKAMPIKEIGEWVYYDDGTRENMYTGEVQAQQ